MKPTKEKETGPPATTGPLPACDAGAVETPAELESCEHEECARDCEDREPSAREELPPE